MPGGGWPVRALPEAWKGPLTGEPPATGYSTTVYNGLPIAFEIQLSTTHLDVIAARRDFYMQEGGLLVWLFAEFDTEHRRMTIDDVFYNNNLNAFVVNAKTVEASLKRRSSCWTASGLAVRVVAIQAYIAVSCPSTNCGLTRPNRHTTSTTRQRSDNLRQRSKPKQLLRDDFEAWMGATSYGPEASTQWSAFRRRFKQFDVELPLSQLNIEPAADLSLFGQNNRPWGQKHKHLVEVAHRVANSEKDHLKWFIPRCASMGDSDQ